MRGDAAASARRLLPATNLRHQRVVDFGDGLDHAARARRARRPCRWPSISVDVELGAELLVAQKMRLHLDRDRRRRGTRPRRRRASGWRSGWRRGARGSASTQFVEVGADAVHLVDEGDARHAVVVGLAPHRLGLRLHRRRRRRTRATAPSSTRSERSTSMVKSTWPGRVDDVDAGVAPEAGGRGRGDGDAALLLLLHPVHRRGALVDLADLVVHARVEQDPLGRRGFTRIDVRHDPDVPGRIDMGIHAWPSSLSPSPPVGNYLLGLSGTEAVGAVLLGGCEPSSHSVASSNQRDSYDFAASVPMSETNRRSTDRMAPVES